MRGFFKRKNSFGILYLDEEKADVDEVFDILQRIQVSINHVYAIQTVGLKRIIVKLNDEESELFEKTMKDYEDRVFSLESRNTNVKVINLSTNKIVVTIRNAPFELPSHVLQDILSDYGQVFNVRNQVYQDGKLAGISNGNKTALMTLKKPIPSSLVYGSLILHFHYRGQVRTCHKCGLEGHLAAHCIAQANEAVNRINNVDFPELKKSNIADKTPDHTQTPPSDVLNPNNNDIELSDAIPSEIESSPPIVVPPVIEVEPRDENISASPDSFQDHVVEADIHAARVNASGIAETLDSNSLEKDEITANDKNEKMDTGSIAVKPNVQQNVLDTESVMEECCTSSINEKMDKDDIKDPTTDSPSQEKLEASIGENSEACGSPDRIIQRSEDDYDELGKDVPISSRTSDKWQSSIKRNKDKSIAMKAYNMRKNVRDAKGKAITSEKRKCIAMADKVSRDPVKSTKLHDNSFMDPKQGITKFKE